MRNLTFKTDIKLKFNEYMMKTIAVQNTNTYLGRLCISDKSKMKVEYYRFHLLLVNRQHFSLDLMYDTAGVNNFY